MDRRELVTKFLPGSVALGLFAFTGNNHPVITDLEPKGKECYPCPLCQKDVAWRETTVIETTAHNPHSHNRLYAPAGRITFHMDGTRCSEQLIKYEKLSDPVVHKGIKKVS